MEEYQNLEDIIEQVHLNDDEDDALSIDYEKKIIDGVQDQVDNTITILSDNNEIFEHYLKMKSDAFNFPTPFVSVDNTEEFYRENGLEEEYDRLCDGLVKILSSIGLHLDYFSDSISMGDLYDLYTVAILDIHNTIIHSYFSATSDTKEDLDGMRNLFLDDGYSFTDRFFNDAYKLDLGNYHLSEVVENINNFKLSIDNDSFQEYIRKVLNNLYATPENDEDIDNG